MNGAADEREPSTSDAEQVIAARPVPAAPIAAHERIETVDVLRGFAIFGILAVNMLWFAHPIYVALLGTNPWPGTLNQLAYWLIAFFCMSKFYSLFSFLFGFGAAIQMTRADARGVSFAPLYARRLIVLLVIGIAHVVLLWCGDILIAYALVGLLLLAFCRRQPRTLIAWALPCLLLGTVITAGLLGLSSLAEGFVEQPSSAPTTAASQPETAPGGPSGQPDFEGAAARAYETYAHGSFGEIVVQRLGDYAFMLAIMVLFLFGSILGMFLFGLYAARRGVLHAPAAHLGFVRRVALWGLLLGVPANLAIVILGEFTQPSDISVLAILLTAANAVGAPALCLFYAAGIVMLMQKDAWRRRLRPFSAVGRMALTNYLMHSLICTTLFYSYGFGFFGQVGPALGLLLTCVIYALQIPLSNWWLRRFRFGPVEWLWRSLTYGRRQPMRLAPAS